MVYDKQPVTIEDAINIDHQKVKRIKIDMLGDKKIIFDSIYYKENLLYGLKLKSKEKNKNEAADDQYAKRTKNIKKKIVEVQINEDEIIQIRLHNKSKTLTLNIVIAIVSVPAIIVGGHMIAFAMPQD
jgi:Fe2+ transport system protein B